MTAVIMQPAELEAFVKAVGWLSVFGGMAGAAVMWLLGYAYQWLTRHQRERDFREDLACIVDELEAERAHTAHANAHYAAELDSTPAPWPPVARRMPLNAKAALAVMPLVLVLSIFLWARFHG